MASTLLANPHYNEALVPKDPEFHPPRQELPRADHVWVDATDALRITLDWQEDESYHLNEMTIEHSGTPGLAARALKKNPLGSYQGSLRDLETGAAVYFDAIGTGSLYRKIVRAISFRFPVPAKPMLFVLEAENPQSGVMEKVFETVVDPSKVGISQSGATMQANGDIDIRNLKAAQASPTLFVTLYAEGYQEKRKDKFWRDAQHTLQALTDMHLPLAEHIEVNAVFKASEKKLGTYQDLGMPIPDRDSFLGLYYPYWLKIDRWYDVVYPTRETHYRQAIALAPYDYPIAIIDNGEYWGVGNFNALTAIPADSSSFTYLLHHEFGHFFGLNEEYEGGGPTELEFAPGIEEPWSQNITFLPHGTVKWKEFMAPDTPVPTASGEWEDGHYGAYRGGYADSAPTRSHKPGFGCTMSSEREMCAICQKAIEDKIRFDIGL